MESMSHLCRDSIKKSFWGDTEMKQGEMESRALASIVNSAC